MTGNDVAARLGVSRRTLYRWHDEGRLYAWQWNVEHLEQYAAQLVKRKRGPKRNPHSVRYGPRGRHRYE